LKVGLRRLHIEGVSSVHHVSLSDTSLSDTTPTHVVITYI